MLKHKYKAVSCQVDGMKFPSKLERNYYLRLLTDINSTKPTIAMFLRQVPFNLPGGVIYRADFMVFYLDGTVEVIDVKGIDTPQSKMKRKMVESLYPVEIKLIKRV